MRPLILSILVTVTAIGSLTLNSYADEEEVKAATGRIKDQKLKDHLMSNIDIFGKTDLSAIYIFAPGFGDDEVRGSLITRDFSRDPFFMQNIDREEFEMKVVLREINGEVEFDKDDEKKQESKR